MIARWWGCASAVQLQQQEQQPVGPRVTRRASAELKRESSLCVSVGYSDRVAKRARSLVRSCPGLLQRTRQQIFDDKNSKPMRTEKRRTWLVDRVMVKRQLFVTAHAPMGSEKNCFVNATQVAQRCMFHFNCTKRKMLSRRLIITAQCPFIPSLWIEPATWTLRLKRKPGKIGRCNQHHQSNGAPHFRQYCACSPDVPPAEIHHVQHNGCYWVFILADCQVLN